MEWNNVAFPDNGHFLSSMCFIIVDNSIVFWNKYYRAAIISITYFIL